MRNDETEKIKKHNSANNYWMLNKIRYWRLLLVKFTYALNLYTHFINEFQVHTQGNETDVHDARKVHFLPNTELIFSYFVKRQRKSFFRVFQLSVWKIIVYKLTQHFWPTELSDDQAIRRWFSQNMEFFILKIEFI